MTRSDTQISPDGRAAFDFYLFVFIFFLLTSLALSGRCHFRQGGIDVGVGGLWGKHN